MTASSSYNVSNDVQNVVREAELKSNDVRPVLVVVHPGSCCGSADMNLGRYEAGALRDGLTIRLKRWKGPVLVIDGTMSDELSWPQYDELGRALRNALRRARYNGYAAKREWGCDDAGPGSGGAMETLLREGLVKAGDRVVLTGAWATNDEDWGCVNGAANVLTAAGIKNEIDDSAFFEAEEGDEDEDAGA